MLVPGTIVEGYVYRVEVYGIFMRCSGEEVFVHLPEVSWTDFRLPTERGFLHQTLRVLILRNNPDEEQWIGSLRKAEPEENPYLAIAMLPPGTVLRAEVIVQRERRDALTCTPGRRRGSAVPKSEFELIIRLANGAWGFLQESEATKDMRVGDVIEVVVETIDPEEGFLRFRLNR